MSLTFMKQKIAPWSCPTSEIKEMAGRSKGVNIIWVIAALFETATQKDTVRSYGFS